MTDRNRATHQTDRSATTAVFTIDGNDVRVDLTDDILVLHRHNPATGMWIEEARATPRAAVMLAALGAELDLDTTNHQPDSAGRVVPFHRPGRGHPPVPPPSPVAGDERSVETHPSSARRTVAANATATRES